MQPGRFIPCPIAGTTIFASWRRGGKYLEPSRAYIRCSERDCQYVDLNTPPCPLSVEMVQDDSFERIKTHLMKQAGTGACYACVAETLGVTHQQLCATTSQLKETKRLVVRAATCGVCRRRRLTLMVPPAHGIAGNPAVQTAPAPGPLRASRTPAVDGDREGRLLARLPAQPVICAACLALSANLALRETLSALELLNARGLLRRRLGSCATCCREVVGFARMLEERVTPGNVCTLCGGTIRDAESLLAIPQIAHLECLMREPTPALPDAHLVVVVDSQDDARVTASKLLQDAGVRVLIPETAREALGLLDAAAPSLYLLNLNPHDLSGIRLCAAIRRLRPATQVLAVTEAACDGAERQVVLKAGAAGILARPVSRSMLVGAVRTVLAYTA
jgi:CheY-like chemotaxis protein